MLRREFIAAAWLAVLVAAIGLALTTIGQIQEIGLTGPRPPLSAAETALRIALVLGAVAFVFLRRHPLERVTLIVGALAAGSSALFGFGMRSPLLSAFRLLSHLVLYMLATVCAARLVAVAWRSVPNPSSSIPNS